MKQRENYDIPYQVAFIEKWEDEDEREIQYGIAYNKEVICACCGAVFGLDEVEILTEYEWITFKDEIGE